LITPNKLVLVSPNAIGGAGDERPASALVNHVSFLEERRKLMALKIKTWVERL